MNVPPNVTMIRPVFVDHVQNTFVAYEALAYHYGAGGVSTELVGLQTGMLPDSDYMLDLMSDWYTIERTVFLDRDTFGRFVQENGLEVVDSPVFKSK